MLPVAAATWGQGLQVDLAGNGGEVAGASADLRLQGIRLIARTHAGTGRSVVGLDTHSLSVGPLRLAGLARVLMASPLGLYPWSSALTAASGPLLDGAQVPSGRFGAALRADDAGYFYVMRRSRELSRLGGGAWIRHDAGLDAELAAVFSRLAPESVSAAGDHAPSAPAARMVHAAVRFRATGDLLAVTAVPIIMAADRLPPAGAGVVSAGLASGPLTVDGSLAFAGRRYFTGDAKRAAGTTAAFRVRAAGDAGQSLELRSQWRSGASPERVLTARLAAGAGAASGFYGTAEVSHRTTRSSDRVRVSARAEARDGGNRGWLSGSLSTTGGRTTSRIEVGARLQAAPEVQLTVAAGWAGKEWSARVGCVLRGAGHQVDLDLDDDGDWGIGLQLRR